MWVPDWTWRSPNNCPDLTGEGRGRTWGGCRGRALLREKGDGRVALLGRPPRFSARAGRNAIPSRHLFFLCEGSLLPHPESRAIPRNWLRGRGRGSSVLGKAWGGRGQGAGGRGHCGVDNGQLGGGIGECGGGGDAGFRGYGGGRHGEGRRGGCGAQVVAEILMGALFPAPAEPRLGGAVFLLGRPTSISPARVLKDIRAISRRAAHVFCCAADGCHGVRERGMTCVGERGVNGGVSDWRSCTCLGKNMRESLNGGTFDVKRAGEREGGLTEKRCKVQRSVLLVCQERCFGAG